MQNRYVGDVADFGKYGLLRYLSGETSGDNLKRLKLGVVWYMFPDQRHGADKGSISGDGRHIEYLTPIKKNIDLYGNCDPELWAKLGHLVGYDARCVHCAELDDVLPDGTLYYHAQLYYVPDLPRKMKEATREHWFCKALEATNCADLVFVDPDNGIADSAQMYRQDGPKYAYIEDLRKIRERDQNLVVYQHKARKPSYDEIADKIQLFRDGFSVEPIPLWFRRGSPLVFT